MKGKPPDEHRSCGSDKWAHGGDDAVMVEDETGLLTDTTLVDKGGLLMKKCLRVRGHIYFILCNPRQVVKQGHPKFL